MRQEFETLVPFHSILTSPQSVRVLVIAETSQAAAEEYTNPALHTLTQQLQNIHPVFLRHFNQS